MTHEEKKLIGKMRSAGHSYVRIAQELDISINSVKSYCRRHGLGADRALLETQPLQAESSPPPQKATACEQCGSPVRQEAGRKYRRFCSDTCRQAWWTVHRGEMNRRAMHHFVCEYCGMQFSRYGVTDRRFCSKTCAAHARGQKEAHHDA